MEQRKCRGNAIFLLRNREYDINIQNRKNFRILRKLVCDGNYTYKKVWEKFSSKPIACERNHAYFDNYTECYGGYGTSAEPRYLYNLYSPHGKKIVDALAAMPPVESITRPFKHNEASLFCIVGKSWLVQYSWRTGKVTFEIYLSNRFHFSHISWNEVNQSIVVSSTHNISTLQPGSMSAGVRVVKVLILFDIAPLKFTAMLEISKKIFGKDVVNAAVSQGLLITMHYSGFVKFYSLDFILKEFPYEDDSDGNNSGVYPVGLHRYVKITYQPPVLFQVKCNWHMVDIGGFPWHYLYTPYGNRGSFQVRSLSTNQLATAGRLEMKAPNFEPDRASFFGDESGRILYIGAADVKLLSIMSQETGKSCVEEEFCISLDRRNINKVSDEPMYTSSGRRVHKMILDEDVTEFPNFTIYNVDYEDELDVLWTSAVYYQQQDLSGIVSFHDNLTGLKLKEITLEEPFTEIYEHKVLVDLDTIIQIAKSGMGEFVCIFYRLTADLHHQECQPDEKELCSSENPQELSRKPGYRRKSQGQGHVNSRSSQRSLNEDISSSDEEWEMQDRRIGKRKLSCRSLKKK